MNERTCEVVVLALGVDDAAAAEVAEVDGDERGVAHQAADVLRILHLPAILGEESVHGQVDVLHDALGASQHVHASVEDPAENLPGQKLLPFIARHRYICMPISVRIFGRPIGLLAVSPKLVGRLHSFVAIGTQRNLKSMLTFSFFYNLQVLCKVVHEVNHCLPRAVPAFGILHPVPLIVAEFELCRTFDSIQ